MLSSLSPYSFIAMLRPPALERQLGNLLHYKLNFVLNVLIGQHIDRLCGHADAPKGLRPDTLHELDFLTAEFLFDLGLTAAAIEVNDLRSPDFMASAAQRRSFSIATSIPSSWPHVFSCS